jgi:hypothetical protein
VAVFFILYSPCIFLSIFNNQLNTLFYLKLFYSFMNLSKIPYICFGLISDHLQGVTTTLITRPYVRPIAYQCRSLMCFTCALHFNRVSILINRAVEPWLLYYYYYYLF